MEFAFALGVVLGLVVGAAIGAIGVQLKGSKRRARLDLVEDENRALKTQASGLQEEVAAKSLEVGSLQARLEATNKRFEEQLNLEALMADKFKALSAEAISDNSKKFLDNANERIGTLVKPLSEELKRIETERAESQGRLAQQMETAIQSTTALQQETRNLTTALRKPEVRGNWGELHLRRVVELAGMVNYCDFDEQVTMQSLDGGQERPDMVIRLPSERNIIIDAKTPLDAYLSAAESETDGERHDALTRHAGQVKQRAQDLSKKSYWRSFDKSPEFVVMYLPGEFFLLPALERDPTLLEWAMENRVVIATPNTLMALLKTVEMGWKEVKLAREAAEVAKLGKEIHDRIETWAGHMVSMGKSLDRAVENFNKGMGSLESQVLTSARRFKELGISSSKDIPDLPVIDTQVRQTRKLQPPPQTPALSAVPGEEKDDH